MDFIIDNLDFASIGIVRRHNVPGHGCFFDEFFGEFFDEFFDNFFDEMKEIIGYLMLNGFHYRQS